MSPVGRQMAIENSVANDFDQRTSAALTFSIVVIPGSFSFFMVCVSNNDGICDHIKLSLCAPSRVFLNCSHLRTQT